ncbi:uncharacterized protein LOC117341748 [Pecten maximus]|uniref:uncharacterized protein LOC117341748 n=1 Tax=Pecten maximus TaxID=6579 RepID=UPI001458D241|nr:uncharacterized protein LOC117341748 [Pecten maximus]
MQQGFMEKAHALPSSGHFGQTKTLEKLKRTVIWYGMSDSVEQYVASCKVCNHNKRPSRKPRAELGTCHAGYPMERIHMDILGPLPVSRDGNKYILMLVDQFTKWLECFPLPCQNAETVAKTAVDGFSMRQSAWDLHLQQLAGSIRADQHRQTGFTPNRMMLGREVGQPLDLFLGTVFLNQERKEPAEYVGPVDTSVSDDVQTAQPFGIDRELSVEPSSHPDPKLAGGSSTDGEESAHQKLPQGPQDEETVSQSAGRYRSRQKRMPKYRADYELDAG